MNNTNAGALPVQETHLMLQRAKNGNLTAAEAAILLKEYAKYRTLGEKLARVAGEEDLQKRIVDGMCLNHPEMKKDSIQRKVRGWLSNDSIDVLIQTETAIELCFILRLPLETADAFLTSVTEEGFHWRDPEQIPMIFCLNRGEYDYLKAVRLRNDILNSMPKTENTESELFTDQARRIISAIKTENDLRDFVTQMANRLGKRRRSAQRQFEKYMSLLEKPDKALYTPDEKSFTVREVLRTYLHQSMVPDPSAKKAMLPDIAPAQKEVLLSIASSWPTETILSKMKQSQIDVNRKTLILLFLATDGGLSPEDDEDEFDSVTQEEIFEDSCRRMNAMLVSCGYRQLDPRNPFDWMVLYALSEEDLFETDAQIDGVLKALFAGSAREETD